MVKLEFLENGLKRHYSDEGKYLRKIGTNEEYSEAVDIPNAEYEYEELNRYIEVDEPTADFEE